MGRSDRPSGFGSFGDLRKALKGNQGEDPQNAEESGVETSPAGVPERGWTLETGDEEPYELTEEDLEGLPDPDSQIPARIAGRPGAFGPMGHGPACYADVDSEEMELVRSFRLRTQFPDDVLGELGELPENPAPEDH